MANAVIIPDFGTSMDHVVLLNWLKNVGDSVEKGDAICEIETDKATTDIESFTQGVLLKHVVQVGDEVNIGAVIAYIGAAGETVADQKPVAASPQTQTSKPAQESFATNPSADRDSVRATPKLRRLAKERGIDLSTIKPTGPNGQITEKDIGC